MQAVRIQNRFISKKTHWRENAMLAELSGEVLGILSLDSRDM